VTPEQERWAEALAIDQLHGDQAHVHIAERVGAMAAEGDIAGMERWCQIAAKLDKLRRGVLQ
jgi:hypothetical protein